jgi:hypothetical protein
MNIYDALGLKSKNLGPTVMTWQGLASGGKSLLILQAISQL